tara:strand:+ start:34 stop:186 length:153 start_codon:yes stop_codon:yes gene_type:complete
VVGHEWNKFAKRYVEVMRMIDFSADFHVDSSSLLVMTGERVGVSVEVVCQ